MVDLSKISECFTGLVGWKPTADECTVIDLPTNGLDTSSSGLYFNDYSGVTLSLAERALSKDKASLLEYVQDSGEAVTREVALDYVKAHKKRIESKSLLTHKDLGFIPDKSIRDTIAKSGRFVGVKVCPVKNEKLSIVLEQISFGAVLNELSEQTSITLYIYSPTHLDALKTLTLTIESGKIKRQDLTQAIDNVTFDLSEGEEYYIGYYEDDLEGAAIRTRKPCGTCPNSPVRSYGKYAQFTGFTIEAGSTYVDKSLPDIEDAAFSELTYGLNFRVSVGCELTTMFCDNAYLFAKAIQQKMAIKFFWDVYNNANKSQNLSHDATTSKEDARLMAEKTELDYKDELQNISLDFESIDCGCSGAPRGVLGSMGL